MITAVVLNHIALSHSDVISFVLVIAIILEVFLISGIAYWACWWIRARLHRRHSLKRTYRR